MVLSVYAIGMGRLNRYPGLKGDTLIVNFGGYFDYIILPRFLFDH